jgi:hypothetical protein
VGPVYRTKASLRVFGDDLRPDDLTKLLGVPATSSEVKGAPVGRTVSRRGGWRLASPLSENVDLADHIRWLLDATTKDIAVWRDVTSRYSVDIFVGLFLHDLNEGLSLSADLMAELGARGIELGLDIYGLDQSHET